MQPHIPRTPEPELMDDQQEALVYAKADFSEVNERFVVDLLAFCGQRVPRVAMDLGCGPADIPLRLHRHRPTWRILGMDASPAMLALACQRVAAEGIPAHVQFVLAAAQRIPICDGSIDLILSNSLLHHLPDPAALWREIRRIGRCGGVVFIRDLMRPEDEAAARRIVEVNAGNEPPLLQEEFYRSLLSAFTLKEVREQLAGAGLNELNVRPASDRHLDITGVLQSTQAE